MFAFLPACAPWYLMLVFPLFSGPSASLYVRQTLLSLFSPSLYIYTDRYIFFFYKISSFGSSQPARSLFLRVMKMQPLTGGFTFPLRNSDAVPDMPAWIQLARRLVYRTGSNQISALGVCVREMRVAIEVSSLLNRACQTSPGDKDMWEAPLSCESHRSKSITGGLTSYPP